MNGLQELQLMMMIDDLGNDYWVTNVRYIQF